MYHSTSLYCIYVLIFIAILSLPACDNSDPLPENQEELITTLTVTCTPMNGGAISSFIFYDPDGEGGIAPVITADTLKSNTLYSAVLTLLDASTIPPDDITQEILTEADAHQFFFVIRDAAVTHVYDDEDSQGYPVGLLNTITTGEPGTGTMTVLLRHEPDKAAPGVAQGNPEQAGGETDIEVAFPIKID